MIDSKSTSDNLFRSPSDDERALLSRLLEPTFPGRDDISRILAGVKVRTIDEQGSLQLHSDVPGMLTGIKAIPVEAEANDVDGYAIHVLLHVVHGRPDELEIYKDDSSAIQQMPSPSAFEVIVLPAAPWEIN